MHPQMREVFGIRNKYQLRNFHSSLSLLAADSYSHDANYYADLMAEKNAKRKFGEAVGIYKIIPVRNFIYLFYHLLSAMF
jgi:hypothetical protein